MHTSKLIEMCLVHDLPEALCGDLVLDYSRFFKGERTPAIMKKNRVTEKEKLLREHRAMKKLFSNLDKKTKKKFESLWKEFEENKSREARLANDLDCLEMMFQAQEYEKSKNFKRRIWPAWSKANGNRIQNPVLKKLFKQLCRTMR